MQLPAHVLRAPLLALLLVPPLAAARRPVRVAMVLWRGETDSERSFRQVLAQSPEVDPAFQVYDAGGDPARLGTQVEALRHGRYDLVYTFGTSATQAVLARVKDLPVVYDVVARPVESGIIQAWERSGSNATGISNTVPMASAFKTLRLLMHIRKLGVLYTPAEPNAVIQLHEVEAEQRRFGFRVAAVPVPDPGRLNEALRDLLTAGVDGVLLPADSAIQRQGQAIVDFLNKYGIPSISAVPDLVREAGALVALGPDYRELGALAAGSALRILAGADPGQVPSRTGTRLSLVLNLRTAKRLGLTVPIQLIKTSTLVR